MSEFTYLTGRKELFNDAPAAAMVVLEHEQDGRLFYAVDHVSGATYWNEDGTPGSRIGLIALLNKTRVVARRIHAGGTVPAEPKRDPVPNSRLARMAAAQTSAKKAMGGLHSGMNAKPAPAPAKQAKAAAEPAEANWQSQSDPRLMVNHPAPVPAKAADKPSKPTCFCNSALPGYHARTCPEFMESIKNARAAFSPNTAKPAAEPAKPAVTSQGISDGNGSAVGSADFIRAFATPCSRCGNTGVHACPGKPLPPGTVKIYGDGTELRSIAGGELTKATAPADGFVDIFALAEKVSRKNDPVFIRVHTNGNIGIVAAIASMGDNVMIQADPARGLVRIARVETGGKEVSKGRAITATAVTRLFRYEKGQSSIRIDLEKVDGWWQGKTVFAEGVK